MPTVDDVVLIFSVVVRFSTVVFLFGDSVWAVIFFRTVKSGISSSMIIILLCNRFDYLICTY